MAPPNAIYIVHGEISLLVTAMRRNSRWNTHSHQEEEQDPLVNSFYQLRDVLHTISDLGELELNVYLGPFLEVIRSEDTTGPITGLALSSVNKFLSYGLVDPSCVTAASAIENIADAVTHARFVGTDPGSDEVVLMKILHVLRTLMLSTAGGQLTNESVCEIMQSCFRICFEMRLSELLRKSAEHTLMDMVQLLFSRLPQFKEDLKWMASKKLKMRAGGMDPSRTGRKKKSGKTSKTHKKGAAVALQEESRLSTQTEAQEPMEDVDPTQVPDAPEVIPRDPTPPDVIPQTPGDHNNGSTIATTPVAPGRTMVDIHDSFRQGDTDDLDQSSTAAPETSTQCDTSTHPVDTSTQDVDTSTQPVDASIQKDKIEEDNDAADATSRLAVPDIHDTKKILNDSDCPISEHEDDGSVHSATEQSDAASVQDSEYVNPRGIRFTAHQQHAKEGVAGPLVPYGLPCVRELFRFLISLTNPLDRHNTDVMIHMGLSLLAAALESGADNITTYNSLLVLVKDEMTKNLFSLLQSERLSLFAASLRVCFLLFESMRSQLKLQMEMYLNKLMEIIASESIRISYEQRELTLEAMVQLFKIPGLVTEIYLNYDCDLYCSFLFEDLTKLLSKNAFPVSGLFSTHLLCLDALLTVVDSIEQHCHSRILNTPSGHDPQKPVGAIDDSSDDVTIEQPAIAVSGFIASQHHKAVAVDEDVDKTKTDEKKTPFIRPNRMKISQKIPTEEELLAIKHKKKLIQSGADQFNVKPSKGIQFLQDHGLFSTPLQPNEIVQFLKENPTLDKKQIGEYLSRKNNVDVLKAFVKSFHFEDLRVDESLRQYLETFRLPGEAPVISYLIEHFAEHWHQSNPGTHIVDPDAAFTLTYAIIMLNVDQHNHNVKKQSVPMTVKEFKTNVRKVNGGNDFDQDMLEEIYTHIKNDEIVMPAEQTGLVRDNYQWKVLLKRGATKEGIFLHVPTGAFDHDLFHLIWGPTVAALSFVFDKSLDDTIIQKAISGFRKCAMISAHYGLSDVFDNLVISLCKFTTLLSTPESPEHLPITFGTNLKAQLAAKTVFALAHRHGDILREGWKNILECMLQLYKAKLLPKLLVEVEDFLAGRLSLVKEDSSASQRADSGVLSSFYSYFTTDTPSSRGPSPEDQELIKQAHNCIRECHLEQLITDCKFLRIDSLQELIKALIFAGQGGDNTDGIDEDSAVFFLELLIRVVLQNRDRCAPIWQSIRDHVYNLIVTPSEHTMLVERAVVGLLRLAIRLLRREEIAPQVLTSIRILLMMKPKVIHGVSRQIAFGLHELLRTNAANIHSAQDWFTLFSLLEICGAGSNPPAMMSVGGAVNPEGVVPEAVTPIVQRTPEHTDNGEGAQSDSELTVTSQSSGGDRGYTSDSELYEGKQHRGSTELELRPMLRDGSWLLVNKSDLEANNKQREQQQQQQQQQQTPGNNSNLFSIDITTDEIKNHDPKSLMKASETLAFLVRDAVHVTPHNFESCVHTIRTFVEASINGGHQKHPKKHSHHEKGKHKHGKRKSTKMKKSKSSPSNIQMDSDEEDEGEGIVASYHSLSIQLLDLMHTLHTRAAQIYRDWAEEEKNQEQQDEVIDAGTSALWVKCWCPLLQCIARLCCDTRRQVRSQALTYLQRALLVHDLQTLSAVEWEACFNKVLFPLLHKLLGTINPQDPNGIEETRMRASTLLCKVFLQHLSPLLSLSTFTALWLTILDFMDKYMHADRSDLLCEAIPESLKNMLLVMHTAGILEGEESQLWKLTWDRIDSFLPQLREEVFRPHQAPDTRKMQPGTVEDPSSLESPDTPAQTTQPSGSTQALPPPVVKPVVNTQVVSPARPESPDTVIEIGMPDDSDSSRPESPLNQEVTAPQQQYILHPPLPDTPSKLPSVHGVDAPTVPILLNPDIIQGGPMPIISPQGSADELTSEPTSQ